jgi:hypothetical protein
VLVECRVEGASGRQQMRLTDLSPVGCFVDTSIAFPADTQVTLYIQLGESELTLSGRVIPMKQAGFGFGVEFANMDDATREQLDAYIRQART